MVHEMSKLLGEVVEVENTDIISFFQKTLISRGIQNCPAVIFESKVYTFQDLDDISTGLAAVILEKSSLDFSLTVQETPILVCLSPSEKVVAILFGILKLGGSYVPIDPRTPQHRVDEILVALGGFPNLVITNSEFAHKFKNCRVLHLRSIFEELENKECHCNALHGPCKPSEFPAILYTSGSTGNPKGVLISNRTLMNRLIWQWRQFPFSPNEKCCFKTNLSFVDSIAEIFGPLLLGYPITVFCQQTVVNPHILVQKLHDSNISRVTLVPSHLKSLLDTIELLGTEGSHLLQNIRLWISSGEILRMKIIERFFKFFPTAQLCNFYGSTEVMGDVTFETFSSFEDAVEKCVDYSVSIGGAIYNAEIQIWDENDEIVASGITGEICVSGMHILNKGFSGSYQTNEKETIFKTGDLGFVKILDTGEKKVFYLGRKDKNVKIRGQKVNLNAVEEEILKLPNVEGVKVLLKESVNKNSELIAFIAGNNITNAKQIRNQLSGSLYLRSHEVPQFIQVMPKLPMMLNGKIDGQKLLVSCADSEKINPGFPNGVFVNIPFPKYKLAEKMVTILANVTGTAPQEIMENIHASFNEIGGNSLNLVTSVLEMKKSGIEIDLSTFIGASSIQKVIELVLSKNMPLCEMVQGPKFVRERIEMKHFPFVKRLMSRICCSESLSMDCSNLKYSFVARRQADGKLAGLSINTVITGNSTCAATQEDSSPYLLQFVHQAETQARTKLVCLGRILHNLNVEVCENLEMASEKISVLMYLEEENISFAKENHCIGVLTTNTSIVTQEICSELLGYETLSKIQATEFIAQDGSKPFICSPPSEKVVCCFKTVVGDAM